VVETINVKSALVSEQIEFSNLIPQKLTCLYCWDQDCFQPY